MLGDSGFAEFTFALASALLRGTHGVYVRLRLGFLLDVPVLLGTRTCASPQDATSDAECLRLSSLVNRRLAVAPSAGNSLQLAACRQARQLVVPTPQAGPPGIAAGSLQLDSWGPDASR